MNGYKALRGEKTQDEFTNMPIMSHLSISSVPNSVTSLTNLHVISDVTDGFGLTHHVLYAIFFPFLSFFFQRKSLLAIMKVDMDKYITIIM